jgi:hypothetical protein
MTDLEDPASGTKSVRPSGCSRERGKVLSLLLSRGEGTTAAVDALFRGPDRGEVLRVVQATLAALAHSRTTEARNVHGRLFEATRTHREGRHVNLQAERDRPALPLHDQVHDKELFTTFDHDWCNIQAGANTFDPKRTEMFLKLRRMAGDALQRQDITWQATAIRMYGTTPDFVYPEADAPTELRAAQEYWQRFAPHVDETARIADTSITLGPSFQQMKPGCGSPEQRLGKAGVRYHEGVVEKYMRVRPSDPAQRAAEVSQAECLCAAAAEMARAKKRQRVEENLGALCSICRGAHNVRHDARNCPDRKQRDQGQLTFSTSSSSHVSVEALPNEERTAPSQVLPGKKKPRLTSQFGGVCWDARLRKWRALLCVGDKNRFLGPFDSEEEARRAYLEQQLLAAAQQDLKESLNNRFRNSPSRSGAHATAQFPHFRKAFESHPDALRRRAIVDIGGCVPSTIGASGGNVFVSSRDERVVGQPGDGSCLYHLLRAS